MPEKTKGISAIQVKEGKVIFEEHEFLKTFEQKLNGHPTFFKRPLKEVFKESLINQRLLGRFFINRFKAMQGNPYTKDYLHYPWLHSQKYQALNKLFLHHPSFISPFLSTISQHYYYPVLTSWRETQAVAYFSKTSDYCARALPGTSREAKEKSLVSAQELFKTVGSYLPDRLKPIAVRGYEELLAKRWETFGGSLLPLGYSLGDKGYGRLKSIPASTVCNLNKKVKTSILRVIKQTHGISFFELDLKACHAKIFEDMFDWTNFERSDLPPLENLWPSIMDDFWEKSAEIPSYDEIREAIKAWPEGHLRGLIKNQFYKALNGGLPTFTEDNIEKSKVKLKISNTEQYRFNDFLHLAFSKMKVFVLETEFIDQINERALIFLPNCPDGFDTFTLSKAQAKKNLLDPDYNARRQTGNSRLFSNMELCLIMHLYSAVVEADCNWLVVGYEADGILVASDSSLEKVNSDLIRVNLFFKSSIKGLTTADHTVDIKNFV